MDMKALDRAKEIQDRLAKLEKMHEWLEDEKRNIFLISPSVGFDGAISLSEDMKTVLLGMCISEAARLQKEFESL